MQTTLLGLAIALILALVAALAGPLFIDWGRYRATFEAEASRIVGQPVRIGGAIDARILPTPSVFLRDLEIGPRGTPNFRAQTAAFDLALGALMRGQWRVGAARLDGPSVSVGLDASGKIEAALLLTGIDADQVSIDRLVVSNGRLTFADSVSDTRIVLDKLSFDGEVRSLAGPIKGNGSFVSKDQMYAYRLVSAHPDERGTRIRLGLEPADRPLTMDSDVTLTLDNGAPRYEGNVTFARPAGLALANGKTIANDPWRVTGRIKGDTKSTLLDQLDVRYGPEERAVKLTGTAEFTLGATPRLDVVLSARQIDLDRALASSDAASRLPIGMLRGLTDGLAELSLPPIPVSLGIGFEAVTLGGAVLQSVRADFKASEKSWSIDTFEFRAPGSTQVTMSGRIDGLPLTPQFIGPVTIESANPQALMAWLDGGAIRTRPAIGPLRLRGDLTFGPQQVAIDRVAADYDGKAFAGRLAYVYAAGPRRARLDAALSAAEFDLDGMMALAGAAFTGATFDWPGEVGLAVDVGHTTFAGLDARSAKANFKWDAAGLRIERLSVADFGGAAVTATGQIDMSSPTPRGAVTLSVDAQKLEGLSALAAKFAPGSVDIVRRHAGPLAPAKIEASVKVDPAPANLPGVKSIGKLTINGSLGGVRVSVAADGAGDLNAWSNGNVRFDGRFTSKDGTLLAALGLDRMIAPTGGSDLTVTATGAANGDLRVSAQLSGSDAEASAAGTMRFAGGPKGNLDVAVTAANLRAAGPDSPAFPVTLKSRVAFTGDVATLADISGTAAGSPVRGQLTFGLQPLRIEGRIAADAVDVPTVIAAAMGMSPAAAKSAAWPSQPFAPSPLADADGRLEFDAAQATISPALVAHKLRGVVRFKPSEITFDDVSGILGEGSVAGWAKFRTISGGLSASGRVAVTNADAAAVFRSNGQPAVIGRVSSQIALEAEGSNPAALVNALRGKGSVTLEGAQIVGLDSKAFDVANRAVERGISITSGHIGDIIGRVMDAGALPVSWASAPIEISSGRLALGKVVTAPQSDDLALTGSLDLVERTLSARFTMFGTPANGTSPEQRPEISVVLKGPIAAPQRSVDVAALVGWLTMRSVERESKRLEAAEKESKRRESTNSVARDEPPPSTSSSSVSTIESGLALPSPLDPAPPRSAPRHVPQTVPSYGTASVPVPLPAPR